MLCAKWRPFSFVFSRYQCINIRIAALLLKVMVRLDKFYFVSQSLQTNNISPKILGDNVKYVQYMLKVFTGADDRLVTWTKYKTQVQGNRPLE